ncbi:MAG: hypothetical protein ACI8QF_003071 [Limisphaerales bacterium]|jgi:hypothetical protein
MSQEFGAEGEFEPLFPLFRGSSPHSSVPSQQQEPNSTATRSQPRQSMDAGPPNMEKVITMKAKSQVVRRNWVIRIPIPTTVQEMQAGIAERRVRGRSSSFRTRDKRTRENPPLAPPRRKGTGTVSDTKERCQTQSDAEFRAFWGPRVAAPDVRRETLFGILRLQQVFTGSSCPLRGQGGPAVAGPPLLGLASRYFFALLLRTWVAEP